MSLLSFLLRASRGVAVLSILAGIGSGLGGVGLIALVHAELGHDQPSTRVLAWAFALLCLLTAITRVVAQASLVRLAQGSVSRLATHLGERILALPLRQFEEIDPASLLAVLTDDTIVLSNALIGIPLICINLPIVVACLVYVGWLSLPVLVCGLAFAVPGLVGYRAIAARGMRQLTLGRAGQDVLVGHFGSLIEGFRELKVHRARREAFLADHLQAAAEAVRDRNTAGMTLFATAGSWSQLAFFGFMGFVLFALPAVHELSPRALSGAILVALYIMSPLEVIMTWLPVLGRARVSMRKIRALDPSLESDASEIERPAPVVARPFRASLQLDGVTYSYSHGPGHERDRFVLGPIDLTLRPEELVIVAGGNGSGKTTLIKVLTGLYTPDAGQVRLDGRAVSAEGLEDYRQLFSVVFAGGHLFKTLIGLDRPGLDELARDGLVRLGLDDLVRVDAGAFSTTELSEGQRKRLALLTALLEDRPVYVLDEWASHQDPEFKKVFYGEILPGLRARGKTVVAVTHDEEFFRVADRVIRLEGGWMSEGGGRPARARHPRRHPAGS
jgi:putative ATP-binding cassette transporter